MKKLIITSKLISILLLIVGTLVFSSCNNKKKNTTSNEVNTETQISLIEKDHLIGSWKDSSAAALHFTLFKDGTARSDNMKTLLYKSWSVNGNEITFTIESIGNGTSSIDDETYTIDKLTKDELILSKGTYKSEYTRK
ncbi:MAG: lipocalin family protein [Candidatus Saccharimonadaceae bacterium]